MNTLLVAALTAVTTSLGEVKLDCDSSKGWTFSLSATRDAAGREIVKVSAKAGQEGVPPAFTVSFRAPGAGVHHVWTSHYDREGFHLWPEAWKDWKIYRSELASECPLAVAFDERGRAKLAMAASEVFEHLDFSLTANESTCELLGRFKFFMKPAAPRASYEASILLDRRDSAWYDAVRESADWIAAAFMLPNLRRRRPLPPRSA